ncbi:MAG: deoxyribonuclease V [Rhodospirillaceae bacterium]|nr:deoxyribonuclease V [Rhodospirillaceae bacterium]
MRARAAAPLHAWDLSPKEAIALQKALAGSVVRSDRFGPGGRRAIRRVAGVDAAFADGGRVIRAAAVMLDFPGLVQTGDALIERPTAFPYVPGLLSFREVPALLEALGQLPQMPDLILCDGHGYAHPRRFGLACHLGLWLDVPTIGVAKSRLTGAHDEPGSARGDVAWLLADGGARPGERIGAVLRTREKVKPVYVSAGHRVSLRTAVALTLACATRYRLPEPTRLADKLSKAHRAGD